MFGQPSGFDLQKLGDVHRMYWAIPVASTVAIIAAIVKDSQRTAAQIAGVVPFAILIYWLVKVESNHTNFLNALSYGAYLALASGVALLILSRWLK